MPFTFKLSQRLARMRCAALLLSTATCVAGEKPEVVVLPAPPPSQKSCAPSPSVARRHAIDNVAVACSRGRKRERETAEFFDSCERVAARGADSVGNPKMTFSAVVFVDSARWAQAAQPLS